MRRKNETFTGKRKKKNKRKKKHTRTAMMRKEEEELWKKKKKASKRSRLVIIYQVSWNNTRRDLQKPFSSLHNAVAYRGREEGKKKIGEKKKERREREERLEGNPRANFAIPAPRAGLPLKNSQENLARLRQPISFCYAGKYQKFRWPCVVPYLAFTFGWSASMLPRLTPCSPIIFSFL